MEESFEPRRATGGIVDTPQAPVELHVPRDQYGIPILTDDVLRNIHRRQEYVSDPTFVDVQQPRMQSTEETAMEDGGLFGTQSHDVLQEDVAGNPRFLETRYDIASLWPRHPLAKHPKFRCLQGVYPVMPQHRLNAMQTRRQLEGKPPLTEDEQERALVDMDTLGLLPIQDEIMAFEERKTTAKRAMESAFLHRGGYMDGGQGQKQVLLSQEHQDRLLARTDPWYEGPSTQNEKGLQQAGTITPIPITASMRPPPQAARPQKRLQKPKPSLFQE